MTALFSTRRRADEFAAALDGAPGRTAELQELVGLATAMRSHASGTDARPRDDFAAELRSRLMAEAERTLAPSATPLTLPVRRRGPRERRLVAAASAVVLLGGSAGMAAAAQQSLPGEALYPIKRGIERAEAQLSVSTAGKGQDLLQQANDRLDEVHSLLAGDSLSATPRVPQTIADFIDQAQEGAGLLMSSFEETRDPESIVAVREFTAHSIALLQDLARTAPAEAQDELADAALALGDIDQRASALCASCGADLPALEVPDMFLAAAEVDRALTVVQGRALDNSHPFIVDKRSVAKPATTLADVTRTDRTGTTDTDDSDGDAAQQPEDDATTPSSPLTLPALPEGETDTSNGDDDVTKTVTDGAQKLVDETTGSIADGLSGVVETVLPDPLAAQ